MISHNGFTNKANNNLVFADIEQTSRYTKNIKATLPTHSVSFDGAIGSMEIDTDICLLSSRKLWQILKLSQLKGCELDRDFLQHVQHELIMRDDFDNGEAWHDPH